MEPSSHYYHARGLRLHYVDWGNPNAPPLVLIHGGLDHCRSWDWTARAFCNERRVFALDLAGHGDSDHTVGGFYPMTDFVFDLAAFFHERNLERVTLVGHSMGGGVSSLFAGAFPESIDRLILIEGLRPAMLPRPPPHERLRNWIEQATDLYQRKPRAYASIDEAVARMRDANPRLSLEQATSLTRYGLKQGADGAWRWKYDNLIRSRAPAPLSTDEVAALWRRVACPVLLIGGADSGRPDPRANGWADCFADARTVMVPGAGHWVHHDRLDDVLSAIRSFLADPASGRR